MAKKGIVTNQLFIKGWYEMRLCSKRTESLLTRCLSGNEIWWDCMAEKVLLTPYDRWDSETGLQWKRAASLTFCWSRDETIWQKKRAVSLTSCWPGDEMFWTAQQKSNFTPHLLLVMECDIMRLHGRKSAVPLTSWPSWDEMRWDWMADKEGIVTNNLGQVRWDFRVAWHNKMDLLPEMRYDETA